MDIIEKYGPFANAVAIAGFLVATFAVLLLKIMGRINRWTWFTPGTAAFMSLLPARLIVIVLMVVAYVTININNYYYFLGAALLFALIGCNRFFKFNELRNVYVKEVPEVGKDGKPLVKGGKVVNRAIVVGLEKDIMPHIRPLFKEARKKNPHIDIIMFMAGFGGSIYDPYVIWDRQTLASIINRLVSALVMVMLCSVMGIYLASMALSIFMNATGAQNPTGN